MNDERIQTVLLLVVLFLVGAKAQTYIPFPADTAIWTSYEVPPQCQYNCPVYRTLQMGDTTLNSLAYKKVYRQQGHWGPCGGNTCFYPDFPMAYKGGMRQDSLGKKVYFFFASGSQEALLYDFNLVVGDTLHTPALTSQGQNWIVQKIDSVMIGPRYHKRFLFDTAYTTDMVSHLIEGVGNSFGVLQAYAQCFEGCTGLCCSEPAFCSRHVLHVSRRMHIWYIEC